MNMQYIIKQDAINWLNSITGERLTDLITDNKPHRINPKSKKRPVYTARWDNKILFVFLLNGSTPHEYDSYELYGTLKKGAPITPVAPIATAPITSQPIKQGKSSNYDKLHNLFTSKHATEPQNSPYLINKGVNNVITNNGAVCVNNSLILPIYDIDNKHLGYQQILPDSQKWNAKNGKTLKGFVCIPSIEAVNDANDTNFCEGYATGLSIYNRNKQPIICVLSAGNIAKIVIDFHAKYPEKIINIYADNDVHLAGLIGALKGVFLAPKVPVKVLVKDGEQNSKNNDASYCINSAFSGFIGTGGVYIYKNNTTEEKSRAFSFGCISKKERKTASNLPSENAQKNTPKINIFLPTKLGDFNDDLSGLNTPVFSTYQDIKKIKRVPIAHLTTDKLTAIALSIANQGHTILYAENYKDLTALYFDFKKTSKKSFNKRVHAKTPHDTEAHNLAVDVRCDLFCQGKKIDIDYTVMDEYKTEQIKHDNYLKSLERNNNVVKFNGYLPFNEIKRGMINILFAPMGSGKTYSALQYVNKHNNEKVSYVSPLAKLAVGFSYEAKFDNYQDIKTNMGEYQHVAFCIDSITRYTIKQGIAVPDTLIVDEIETILNRLAGNSVDAGKKANVISALEFIIKNAKTLIIADAHISYKTLKYLKKIRNEKLNIIMPASVKNNCVIEMDDFNTSDNLLNELLGKINTGERVYIACNERSMTQAIYDECLTAKDIYEKLSDDVKKNTLLINSDTTGNPAVLEWIENPTEHSKKYQVIIASPSVGTGVSIESDPITKQPAFPNVYAFMGARVFTPNDALQQIRRVRDVNLIKMWIDPTNVTECKSRKDFLFNENTKKTDDHLLKIDGETGKFSVINERYENMRADFLSYESWQKSNFYKKFIIRALIGGFTLKRVTLAVEKGLTKELKDKATEARNEAIATSELLTTDDKGKLDKSFVKTQGETYQLEKANINDFYGSSDMEVVKLDKNGKTRAKLNRLAMLLCDVDVIKKDKLLGSKENKQQRTDDKMWAVKRRFYNRVFEHIDISVNDGELQSNGVVIVSDLVQSKKYLSRYRDTFAPALPFRYPVKFTNKNILPFIKTALSWCGIECSTKGGALTVTDTSINTYLPRVIADIEAKAKRKTIAEEAVNKTTEAQQPSENDLPYGYDDLAQTIPMLKSLDIDTLLKDIKQEVEIHKTPVYVALYEMLCDLPDLENASGTNVLGASLYWLNTEIEYIESVTA